MADKNLINMIERYDTIESHNNNPIDTIANNEWAKMATASYDLDEMAKQSVLESNSETNYGDLSTWVDNKNFEQSVNDKYSFQAKQTNAMTSAADMIANADLANQVANRKIDNLQQQKQINDQIVESTEKFAKAMNLPPVIGTIMGLFDDDYSVGKQFSNLARDYTQLDNLQKQDALDDQLVLQQAFGQAGYNPLANQVIETANQWEKQYVDEQTALQRNKIAARSQQQKARNAELDKFKAITDRMNALQKPLGISAKTNQAIFNAASKADQQDVDIYKTNSANLRSALGADVKTLDAEIAMLKDQTTREGFEIKRESNAIKREGFEIQRGILDLGVQKLAQTAAQLDFNIAKQKYKEDVEMPFKRAELSTKQAGQDIQREMLEYSWDKLGFDREKLNFQKDELEAKKAGKGYFDRTKTSGKLGNGLSPDKTNELRTKVQGAISEGGRVLQTLPLLQQMNNGALANSPEFQVAAANLQYYGKVLSEAMGTSPDDVQAFDQAFQNDYDFMSKVSINTAMVIDAVSKIDSLIKDETTAGSAENKAITKLRLSNNGVVPASQSATATDYLITETSKSNNGTSIEGHLWNNQLFENFNDAMVAGWEQLSPQLQASAIKESGIDSSKYASNQQKFVIDVINALNSSKSSKDSEKVVLLKRQLNPQRVFDEMLVTRGVDENGRPVPSVKQQYASSLSANMNQFKATTLADIINKKYANNKTQFAIDSDFNGVADPAEELGFRLIDAGYSYDNAVRVIDQFRSASLTRQWADNYRNNAISYDNIAASLMSALRYDDFVDNVIILDSGQAGSNSEAVTDAYNITKANIKAYADQKAAVAIQAQALTNNLLKGK